MNPTLRTQLQQVANDLRREVDYDTAESRFLGFLDGRPDFTEAERDEVIEILDEAYDR